jgi:hypothetical protein
VSKAQVTKGKCSVCKEQLTKDSASFSVFNSGYGRCRVCENERQKIRSRTLGGRFRLGSTQAKFNKHKWEISFKQYAAIVAAGECFYCGGSLPEAASGLDRISNGDYTWDDVLPCCGKQPKAKGPRGCNEIKSGEIPPILLFVRRWYEKYGQLPTEEDFNSKLRKFKVERDSAYKILSTLSPQEIKMLKQHISVRAFLSALGLWQ